MADAAKVDAARRFVACVHGERRKDNLNRAASAFRSLCSRASLTSAFRGARAVVQDDMDENSGGYEAAQTAGAWLLDLDVNEHLNRRRSRAQHYRSSIRPAHCVERSRHEYSHA